MPGTPLRTKLRRDVIAAGGVEALLARIAAGETISKIAKDFGVSRPMMSIFLSKNAGRDAVVAAQKSAAGALVDQALEIADSATHDDDRAARLKIDVRKWLAGRLDPETFGEKTGPLVEVNLGALHLEALKKVEAAAKGPGLAAIPAAE